MPPRLSHKTLHTMPRVSLPILISFIPTSFRHELTNLTFLFLSGRSKHTLLLTEIILALIGLYVGLCCMYYMFRRHSVPNKQQTNMQKKTQASLFIIYVLVIHVQILGSITDRFDFTEYNEYSGTFLVRVLMVLVNVISFDIAGLFASPACYADMEPLEVWWFQVALLVGLVCLFVGWFSIVYFWHKYHKEGGSGSTRPIFQALKQMCINIFLIGLTTTILRTFLKVHIENQEETLVMDRRIRFDAITSIQVFSGTVLGIYFLAYTLVLIKLIHSKWSGTLEDDVKNNLQFRELYGWAVLKYHTNNREKKYCKCCQHLAFTTEIVNFILKLLLLWYPSQLEFILYMVIYTVYNIMVQPYKHSTSNYISIIFCVVNVLGILLTDSHFVFTQLGGGTEHGYYAIFDGEPGEDGILIPLISIFIMSALALIFTLLALLFRSYYDEMKMKKKKTHVEDGTDTIGGTFGPLEKRLLFPVFGMLWFVEKFRVQLKHFNVAKVDIVNVQAEEDGEGEGGVVQAPGGDVVESKYII